jgi:hypothetical protein
MFFLFKISFDGYNTKHDIPEKLVLSEEEVNFQIYVGIIYLKFQSRNN